MSGPAEAERKAGSGPPGAAGSDVSLTNAVAALPLVAFAAGAGLVMLLIPLGPTSGRVGDYLARQISLAGAGTGLFWDPRAGGLGAPLLADPGYAALYPAAAAFRLLPVPSAFAVVIALHLALWLLPSLVLLRNAGFRPLVAAGAALVSGLLALAAGMVFGVNFFLSAGWAPLFYWALLRKLRGGDEIFTATAGAAFGLALLAGGTLAACATAAAAFIVVPALARSDGEDLDRRSLLRPLLAVLALGALIGAGQIVTTAATARPEPDDPESAALRRRLQITLRQPIDPKTVARAFSIPQAKWVNNRGDALAAVSAPSFTGRDFVVLEGSPSDEPGPDMGNNFWPLNLQVDENDRLTVVVDGKHPGWLVLLDGWHPDWRAEVNGRPVPVYRANGFFRAVKVGTELSRVDFYFRPRAGVAGLALSLVGSVLAAFFFFRRRTRLLGWALWSVILALTPMVEGGTTYIPVAVLRSVVLALAALWALGLTKSGAFIRSRLDYFVLGFWLLTAASAAGSAYFFISFYWYLNITAFVMLYFVTVQLATADPSETRRLFGLAVFAGAVQSVWAVAEVGNAPQASAGYFNPSYLAGSLMMVSPYLLARALDEWRKNRARAAGWAALLLLFGAGVVASESRAIVVWPAALLAAGWPGATALLETPDRSPARARKLAALTLAGALLAAAAGLALTPNPLRERLENIRSDEYAYERLRIWAVALAVTRDHPLGVGPGMFKYYSPRYRFPIDQVKAGRYQKRAENAHNEYLGLAAEMSPLAPLLLGIPAWWLIAAAARAGARRKNPVLLGAAGGLTTAALHAMFDANLHDHALTTLAVMMAGVAAAELGREDDRWTRPLELAPSGTRLLQAGLAIFFLAGVAGNTYFAWSYRQTLTAGAERDASRAAVRLAGAARHAFGNQQPFQALAELYLSVHRKNPDVSLLEEAEKAAKRARELNPADAENYRLLAEVNLELFRFTQRQEFGRAAARMFDEALERDPRNVEIVQGVARLHRVSGDSSAEIEWWEKAVALEPYDLQARGQLVWALARSGAAGPARDQLAELIARWREVKRIQAQTPNVFRNSYQLKRIKIDDEDLQELERTVRALGKPGAQP